MLSLIFLKYVNDRFDRQRNIIMKKYGEEFVDMQEFYEQDNAFFIPEKSRWSYIMDNAKQPDIPIKIDTALHELELNNEGLRGALPNNYFSRLEMDTSKLASLLDIINTIRLDDNKEDNIGRIYEYFLGKFADKEGKGKGEFYTPKSVVNLIAELIEPYDGKIYDPCCGSGGMFVQSMKFIERHQGNRKNVSIYGQESISTTRKLAMMNLAMRGISYNLGEKAADTFLNDLHKDLKVNYIMANPPFNLDDWRDENQLLDDYRWGGYEVPPKGNANYAWILHMVSKLSEDGVAGFLLSNSALSAGGDQKKIREQLIKNDLVEGIFTLPMKMFFNTDISVTLWLINKNKHARKVIQNGKEVTYRDRTNELLFLDLRKFGSPYNKKYIELTDNDIEYISNTYHTWQKTNDFESVPEYSYSATIEEIENNKYNLAPSGYIEFINEDISNDDDIDCLIDEYKDILDKYQSESSNLIDVLEMIK